tara:strand:- start:1135 stop:1503 length:369 start_codon:yes stop_codon:yes gene_type:complete
MPERTVEEIEFKSSGAVTSGAETKTTAYDISRFTEGVFLFHANVATGSSVVITLKTYIYSDDNKRDYLHSTLVTNLDIDSATTTAVKTSYPVTNFGKKLKISYTIGGTLTTTTFDIMFQGKN